MGERLRPRTQFVIALSISTLASVGLLVYGAHRDGNWNFLYLVWNLFLAWVPLLFSFWLLSCLQRKLWSSWEALVATLLWLVFLPNSFYMISDLIHLQDVPSANVLYDAVMLMSFVFTSLTLGIASLYLVHQQLRRRIGAWRSGRSIATILLLCSFAIYLGRDLRWNSWDILVNPAGLLFDVSDRFVHPHTYPDMFLTTFTFWVLLLSIYSLVWRATRLLRENVRA